MTDLELQEAVSNKVRELGLSRLNKNDIICRIGKEFRGKVCRNRLKRAVVSYMNSNLHI